MNYFKTLILLLTLPVLSAHSAKTSLTKSEYCINQKTQNYAKELAQEDNSRMSFVNRGGILGGGVCWWHSRFQRNALYLTSYRPGLNKPSIKQAKKLIHEIRRGKRTVIIPGYSNFYNFSYDFKDLIQKRLQEWQRTDGILKQKWIVGLAGKTEVTPEKLQSMMEKLYQDVVVNKNIIYQKLQLKGITAHAWLVVDMQKTVNGYDLNVIDSNSPSSTNVYHYQYGNTSFQNYYYGKFVPYTGNMKELKKLKKAINKTCR